MGGFRTPRFVLSACGLLLATGLAYAGKLSGEVT